MEFTFTSFMTSVTIIFTFLIGVIIILFSKKLGCLSYENRDLLDGLLSFTYRVKKDIKEKFTGTASKLATFILIYHIFGILWIAFAIFIFFMVIFSE